MLFDRRGVISLCATLAFAVLLLAGCGGKASSAENATTSLASTAAGTTAATSPAASDPASKRFIARTDPLCRKVNARLAAVNAKNKSASVLALDVVVLNAAIERKALTELTALKPPAALAPAWSKMLGYRRALASGLVKLQVAVKHQSQAELPALTNSKKKLHAELNQVATSAGFKDCAKL